MTALRTLLRPALWTPATEDAAGKYPVPPPPLLQHIRDTRKGQAELSEVLGERVREAVELLIQGHGEALKAHCAAVDPADVYRAACRVAMRLVVILFAESRDLLPRDNAVYHESYGLNGLLERLEHAAARGGAPAAGGISAWPRVLALFRLVREGSHHPDLPVTAYGGDLFAPGVPGAGTNDHDAAFQPLDPYGARSAGIAVRDAAAARPLDPPGEHGAGTNTREAAASRPSRPFDSPGTRGAEDGLAQALTVFESACFESGAEVMPDRDVHALLKLLTRTTIRIRQGRGGAVRTVVPVDFSDLSSEYVGILYEGLLDYELKTAPPGDPVIFLAVGDQPALPLSRLEAMDEPALKALFESLKENRGAAADAAGADDLPEDADGGESAGEERQPPEAALRASAGPNRPRSSNRPQPPSRNRTSGSATAPGRSGGRAVRRRPRGWSGSRVAGTPRNAGSPSMRSSARRPGSSSSPPYSAPCAPLPVIRRPRRGPWPNGSRRRCASFIGSWSSRMCTGRRARASMRSSAIRRGTSPSPSPRSSSPTSILFTAPTASRKRCGSSRSTSGTARGSAAGWTTTPVSAPSRTS